MELLEILDEKGNKTGKKAPIEEIYDKGYWHKSVHIWIINDNHELLMQRRNPTKKTFPDMWAISVAGHVRCYEDSVAAGLRELNEEIEQNSFVLDYCFNQINNFIAKKGHFKIKIKKKI